MSEAALTIAEALGGMSSPRVEVARYRGVGPGGASVQLQSGDVVTIPSAAATPPQQEEDVYVLRIDGAWLLIGPTAPRQQWGKVLSFAGGKAVVEYPDGSGITAQLLAPKGSTPAPNDIALIEWSNGGVIAQLYSTAPVEPPAPVAPPPQPQPQQVLFRAIDSATVTPAGFWLSGDTLYTRNSGGGPNYGMWFYGSQIKDAIPASRTILSARVYTPVRALGGAHSIGYHANAPRSGAPSVGGGAAHSPVNGWSNIPLSIAAALIAGQPGQGIAVYGGSGSIYHGRSASDLSGALEVTFQ